MADLNKLKVAELKRMLKEKGLPITGKKDDLIERLKEASDGTEAGTNGADAAEDDELNEDVLNDDDDEEEVSVIETPTKAEPKPAVKEQPKPEQPKKIAVVAEVADNTVGTLKVLSKALSDQEKQADRAKRFGVKSDETLKATRAERFGLPAESEKKADAKSPGQAKVLSEKDAEKLKKRAERFGGSVASEGEGGKTEDVEKLKKRAERFGATTSSTLVKVDTEEKLLKRKARFGDSVDASDSSGTKTAAAPEETDEKKRKRAERFGLT